MNPRHARRFRLLCVLLLAGCVASCSAKTSVTGVAAKAIPHTDADDIVQLIATTVSSDNGGWYSAVRAMCDTLLVPAPVRMTSAPGTPHAVPLSSRTGIRNNFGVPKSGITYQFFTDWLRADGSITTQRDTTSRSLQAIVIVDAGAFIGGNGVSGSYDMQTYSITSPLDHTFVVANLARIDPDTLEFSGFLEDSSFSSVQSTVTPSAAARNWFHNNFVDYTLEIPKRKLATAPYPVGFDSEIHWTIDAALMNGTSTQRGDIAYDYLIEARMVFDGSTVGVLTLADKTAAPTWSYLYKVNLTTGRISRLN